MGIGHDRQGEGRGGPNGNTEASTRWIRSHPACRPSRSVVRAGPGRAPTWRWGSSRRSGSLGPPATRSDRGHRPEIEMGGGPPDPAEHLAEHRRPRPVVLRDNQLRQVLSCRRPTHREPDPGRRPRRKISRVRPSGAAAIARSQARRTPWTGWRAVPPDTQGYRGRSAPGLRRGRGRRGLRSC